MTECVCGGAEGTHDYRYLIIGAGPAGLAFAMTLLRGGERSFFILEEQAEAGGLCRSETVDGFPLDIGGCHLLEYHNPEATQFLFSFLPEKEWTLHERYNCVQLGTRLMGYPFEANLWQLPAVLQEAYLHGMEHAPARKGEPMPENLQDWAYWNFGKEMAEDYFIPYNQKMWSRDLREIGTYWMHKLPPISFEDVRRSCELGQSPQKYAAHKTFYYPKHHGFGEAFLRMAKQLEGHIRYNCAVHSLDAKTRTVNRCFRGETIINTAPWPGICGGFPDKIQDAAKRLPYTALTVTYHGEKLDTNAQAIYYPDMQIAHHRAIFRCNYNAHWPGYWTETNTLRTREAGGWVNPYAYPVSSLQKPALLQTVLQWAQKQGIYGIGRWGEWQHMNSDAAVCRGIHLAKKLMEG